MSRIAVLVAALAAAGGVTGGVARADDDALAKLLARTDAVAREVSRARGLPLKHKIPYDVVDRETLRARLVKEASDAKSVAELRQEQIALARWGEIPADLDLQKLVLDLLTEQIAGYYDPEIKKLTVLSSGLDDPTWAEMVQAHELDHGLQDQSFDLKKLEDLPPTEEDASAARHALVEGDGIAVMIEVTLARQGVKLDWSSPETAQMIEKSMGTPAAAGGGSGGGSGRGSGRGSGSSVGSAELFDRAPLAIREQMLFPYREGFLFVAALRHHKAWSAVDAAFRKPPRSTEQILHPERYLAGDEPVAVHLATPAALAGWKPGADTVWGELAFDLFLRSHGVDAARARIAGDGWGGDRMTVFMRPGDASPSQAVGIVRMEWDGEADAIEAAEAATIAMDHAVPGATVEHTDARTRWLAQDGTAAWVERRGASTVFVIGAPATMADALAADVWTASKIGKPKHR